MGNEVPSHKCIQIIPKTLSFTVSSLYFQRFIRTRTISVKPTRLHSKQNLVSYHKASDHNSRNMEQKTGRSTKRARLKGDGDTDIVIEIDKGEGEGVSRGHFVASGGRGAGGTGEEEETKLKKSNKTAASI